MSALLDELKSVLTHFRGHVAGLVNSGALVTVDRHLAQLDAAAHDTSTADEAVRCVLGELYGTHPVEPAAAPVDEHPTVPVVVGEPGPELTLPEPAHVEPEPVEHGQEDEQHPDGAV